MEKGESTAFDQAAIEQMDADLTAIFRLGYLASVSHALSKEEHSGRFFEVWPQGDDVGPFFRVVARLVDWCRVHSTPIEAERCETPESIKWFFELNY